MNEDPRPKTLDVFLSGIPSFSKFSPVCGIYDVRDVMRGKVKMTMAFLSFAIVNLWRKGGIVEMSSPGFLFSYIAQTLGTSQQKVHTSSPLEYKNKGAKQTQIKTTRLVRSDRTEI